MAGRHEGNICRATESVTTSLHAVKRVERRSLKSAEAVRNLMREKNALLALKGVRNVTMSR